MKVTTRLLIAQILTAMWPSHASLEQTEADGAWHKKMKTEQKKILLEKQIECYTKIVQENQPNEVSDFCPIVWDGISCWPFTRGDSIAQLPCPSYVSGFNEKENATKSCLPDGTWFVNEQHNVTWSNYSRCSLQVDKDSVPYHRFEELFPTIKLVTRTGYGVSLTFLLVAVFILAVIKRLRCPRNSLHMHLFASFIMRAFMALLKDSLFANGVGLAEHMIISSNREHYIEEHNVWDCKLITSLWQYSLMANYCWILMEGLYLHNLIFLALFSDTSGICLYVALGWGLPVLFIIPWVSLRVNLENTLCWTVNKNSAIFWIIRGPITLSILINFVFFVNIARILFLKLTSTHGPDTRKHRYRKLAKSTLVLVPLFGVHYVVFLAMSSSSGLDDTTEIVWLICDTFFASFQGFFVAVLYCFMNGEVQTEIKKKWQNWYQDQTNSANTGRSSIFTQSLTFLTRSRNSTTSVGGGRSKKYNSEKSPCTHRTTDCTSCTSTYYNNSNNSPSPRLGRSSFNWSNYPTATSENNLTSTYDRSPTVERKTSHELVDLSTALTPMVNGTKHRSDSANDDSEGKGENLKLLYMERMESVDLGESAM